MWKSFSAHRPDLAHPPGACHLCIRGIHFPSSPPRETKVNSSNHLYQALYKRVPPCKGAWWQIGMGRPASRRPLVKSFRLEAKICQDMKKTLFGVFLCEKSLGLTKVTIALIVLTYITPRFVCAFPKNQTVYLTTCDKKIECCKISKSSLSVSMNYARLLCGM